MDTGPAQPVGIYGWRKRCLYSFVVLLMVVVIVNLALTVWILRVLDFSIDGMGKLRIVPKGIRLEGEAEFVRPLYVQEMRADDGQVMHLESASSIKMQARDQHGKKSGTLVLGHNKLQAACEEFEISDSDGNVRMSITEDDVTLGGDDMTYLGEAVFEGSVQTPTLRAPHTDMLQIQSENGRVEVAGAGGVSLVALAGDIQLLSDDSIRIHTTKGSIFLESQNIYLKNIVVNSNSKPDNTTEVFQLCMCQGGRLFGSDANSDCTATEDMCGD